MINKMRTQEVDPSWLGITIDMVTAVVRNNTLQNTGNPVL